MKVISKKYSALKFILLCLTCIACDQAVYNDPTDEPSPTNRKAIIQSKPNHAVIYLEDKNLGIETPDTLKWLPQQNNRVTLKLPLFADTTFDVSVLDGEVRNFFIDFTQNTKNVGKIDCTSSPNGADIWLNDSLTNKITPTIIGRLLPAYYMVKFTMAHHRADSLVAKVMASSVANVFMTLEDTSKWISYNTNNVMLQMEMEFPRLTIV